MKTRNRRNASIKLSHSRWLAYATAVVATAFAGSNSAEAAIHYSGLLREQFGPHKPKTKTFPLDQAGDSFRFERGEDKLGNSSFALAGFSVFGIVSAAIRGVPRPSYTYPVSKLPFGENISAGPFIQPRPYRTAVLASMYHSSTQWNDPGLGFVGFKFNNGAGVQYGWARVRMSKLPENAFTVLDYAYADPGEAITAGQRSSDEQIPDQGSLGWLAAGAVGLLAMRKSREAQALAEA